MDFKKEIVRRYLEAGFQQPKAPTDEILRFQNNFSIHFVLLFRSCSDLKKNWRSVHEYLIKDYRNFVGPRDMEWNYYAVFVVTGTLANDKELASLSSEIESEIAFSRKYVFASDEMDELPPGMISPQLLRSKRVSHQDIIDQWEKTLGPKLFNLLLKGSKATIRKRLLSFIEEQFNVR